MEAQKKRRILKWSAAFMMIFAVVFGSNIGKGRDALCLGDIVFNALGISPWSEGTYGGTHYPGMLALVLFIAGFGMFVLNSEDKRKAQRNLIIWIVVVIVAVWLIGLIM